MLSTQRRLPQLPAAEMLPRQTARESPVRLGRHWVLGDYAPLFWFAEAGGVIVPFGVLRLAATARGGTVGIAALLVVLGALAERWTLVVTPLLGHAHRAFTAGGYQLTAVEVATTLAIYVAGGVACWPLGRALRVRGR